MRLCRSRFSLLEILVSLAIIAVVASSLAWVGYRAVVAQQAHSSVAAAYVAVRQAQVLSMTGRVDIELHFIENNGRWSFQMVAPWLSFCPYRKPVVLKGVRQVLLGGKGGKAHIVYVRPSGRVDPTSSLEFQAEDETVPLKRIWFDTPIQLRLELDSKAGKPVS